jgi:hypothetical protein
VVLILESEEFEDIKELEVVPWLDPPGIRRISE